MTLKDDLMESEDPYLKWIKKIKGLSKTTIYLYANHYKQFSAQDLTQDLINDFLQKKKNTSVARGFVKSYLEFLGRPDDFTMPKHSTGKKKKRVIRDYTFDQIHKVRVFSYEQSIKEGLIFDIIYFGALRLMEILDIKVNSFYWSDYFKDPSKFCKLHVFGKGKKERPVLVHPETMQHLINLYLKKKVINPYMSSEDRVNALTQIKSPVFKDLYERKVWKIIKRNSKKAVGIEMRPHELRHTRATELERQGASIRSIQHYLGHSSPQITEIYLHTTQEQSLQEIMEIVND